MAALVCCSAFDIALHDAFVNLAGRPSYHTYGPDFMNADLSPYLTPAAGTNLSARARSGGISRLAKNAMNDTRDR